MTGDADKSDLLKRIEELEEEVNSLRIVLWSRPLSAIELSKRPAKVTGDDLSGPWKVTMHDGTMQIYKVLPV